MTKGTLAVWLTLICLVVPSIGAQEQASIHDLSFFLRRLRAVDHHPELEASHTAMASTWDRSSGNNDGTDFKNIVKPTGDSPGCNILLHTPGPGCIHRIFDDAKGKTLMNYAQLIDDYLGGPQSLRAAVAGMTAEQLDTRPIPGKWSTKQVICHIADFEPVYLDRMKRVIAENEPTLFSGDPDLFAARLAYDQRDVGDELSFIAATRKHMGAILRSLKPEDFQRKGNHSEAGPIALEKLLTNITNHIPHHVKFIAEKRAALALPTHV